ncbi:uncharacterized protein LOC143890338 isoform X2 [Tasmannia lanceolata]|uniref:uncharacterized protein LOC143890338 isoform X2 n=1 Tax=Tasmannia lanceolata TaxID=3420 RepID=UPI0040644F5A
MSVERSFEAWEEMQRQGHDFADRLAQGFTGLLHSHMNPKLFDVEFLNQSASRKDFGLPFDNSGINGVSAIFDIGNKLGQAGAEFGACLNGVVQQFFRRLPLPFRQDEIDVVSFRADLGKREEVFDRHNEGIGLAAEQFRDCRFADSMAVSDGFMDEEILGSNLKSSGHFGRPQGSINITSTYDSRTHDIESSLVARGDLWRAEASHGGSTSGNESSPLFLIQLGPVLFVRDTTLLLPVHLSKQHLLWYGYDRKSFMDLQFPNGQFTYLAGEGLTTSAFLPVFGGLLQAQGRYPGETRFSFSCKNKWGTRITPTVQWPDKSFSLGLAQALAWQRSGLMVQPTIQFSICPTFGGSNPGLRVEFIHSVKEKLNLICGCSCTAHPTTFASISLGRSKWNGNIGSSGIVVRVETPLGNVGQPSFSIQLNSGVEL